MRSIPDPGFAGDDGRADAGLAEALAAADRAGPGRDQEAHHRALAHLCGTRLIVPVVAVPGVVEQGVVEQGVVEQGVVEQGVVEQGVVGQTEAEPGATGPAHEKSSDLATVLMTGRDGRVALLAFTGSASLGRWDPEARPVPVTAQQAAQAAVQEGAAALVLDLAGPVLFVVEGDDLASLAAGHRLVRLPEGRWAWVSHGPGGPG